MIELIVLFAIAAFVLYRLRSVIGTRTGYEPPSRGVAQGEETVEPAGGAQEEAEEAEIEAEAMRNLSPEDRRTLMEMRTAEPSFSLDEFLSGARAAYEMILMAYEESDRETLKSLLIPEVYEAFEQAIAQREEQGLTVEARFIGLRDLRVEGLRFDSRSQEADITLRFVGEMITAVRDSENRVVEGDPNEIRRQTDVWTFSRKMGGDDPNWLLSATGE
jgi:predicted lipid-binding transport protein (Tim44 family)